MPSIARGVSYIESEFLRLTEGDRHWRVRQRRRRRPRRSRPGLVHRLAHVGAVGAGHRRPGHRVDSSSRTFISITPVRTGLLVRDNPRIKVYVHEKGAPHVIDPSKLVNSANQLWGVEGVRKLWGAVLPVPQSNLTILAGGERIHAANRAFDVQYTPGHASHHVSYFDAGDGIRVGGRHGRLAVHAVGRLHAAADAAARH